MIQPFVLALGVPGVLLAGVADRRATPALEGHPDSMRVVLVVPTAVTAGQPVPMTLRISNLGDRPIELYLQGRPTAFDLIVLRGSEVVWRRLEGAVVSAILQVRTLAPGEAIELTDTWDQKDGAGRPIDPGEYTVTGSVLTDGSPLKAAPVPLRINS